MYAIIEVAGKQYWVVPNETVRVDRLESEAGKELTFKALWVGEDAKDGKEAASGSKGAVVAEVVGEMRAPKIIVFRKKPKKAYRKLHGHRQYLTEIKIKSISLN